MLTKIVAAWSCTVQLRGNYMYHISNYWPNFFFFQRELVTKAKELFINHGPWLVQGAVDKLKVGIIHKNDLLVE